MSLFGEPLPFEDETAASLIRRSGFPPEKTYDQMPEVYLCPCCSEFSQRQEKERLLREARSAKEAERRRLLQLDVFDERAKPVPAGDSRRKAYRRIVEDEDIPEVVPNLPPPPPTLDELRRARRDQNVPKLVVTVHHGRCISADMEDPVSVIVRCGAFEGQTAKVPRGIEMLTPWEELFEFPYMNPNEPLEVLVVNDALPEANDHLVGGVVIPSAALHDRDRGDQEPLPVMPEESMQTGYGTCKEGPLGTVVTSWYVRSGSEKMDETAMEQQMLAAPLGCSFVAHRLFQYTDNGAEPYPGGVLCVLRDTDDNCSESVLYTPGSGEEPSLSPYNSKEGYHYLPESPSQVMQLNTEKKLGHILVCVPKRDEVVGEEEELLVIGAVPLDFERLYHKGSAVLLVESKSKEDVLWGEIAIEWANHPLDEESPHAAALEMQKESLFVTVVRGLNLVDQEDQPLDHAYVTVATGELEGATVEAPAADDEDGNRVIEWNQEVRFIEVRPNQRDIEVQVYDKDRVVSFGTCDIGDEDEGVVIIEMHRAEDASERAGEIVVSYKRLHAPHTAAHNPGHASLLHGAPAYEEETEEEDEEVDVHTNENRNGQQNHTAHHSAEHAHHSDADEEEEEKKEEEAQADAHSDNDHHDSEGGDDGANDGGANDGGSEPPEEHPDEGSEAPQSEARDRQDGGNQDIADEEVVEGEEEEALEQASSEEPEQAEQSEQEEEQEEVAELQSHSEEEQEEEQEEVAELQSHSEEEQEEEQEEVAELQSHSEEEQEEEAEEETHDDAHEEEEHQEGEEAYAHEHFEEAEEEQEELQEVARAASEPSEEQEQEQEQEEDEHSGEPAEEHYAEEEQDADRAPVEDEHAGEDEESVEPEVVSPHRGSEAEEDGDVDVMMAVDADDVDSDHDRQSQTHDAASEQEVEEEEDAGFEVPERTLQPRRRVSWKAPSLPSNPDYQKPWYPSGNPNAEQHLPFKKTTLSKKNRENIRELETRKIRIEEESVRRGSTPRGSSARGLSARGLSPMSQ